MRVDNTKKNLNTESDTTNEPGVQLKECPVHVINRWVVLKLVPKYAAQMGADGKPLIALPEVAQFSDNSAVVIGCGGDVPNKEYLLGKHVIYAKFQYVEPFLFKNEKGETVKFIILQDTSLCAVFIDQTQSAQYKINEQPMQAPSKLTRV